MGDPIEILKWYMMAGIEEICADSPVNFLQKETNMSSVGGERPATSVLAQASQAAYSNARDLCLQAETLSELRKMVENFEGCSLKFSANSTVFGYGHEHAQLMIIGEAPGADEDRIGQPFVGRSGHLLDKMIEAIGLTREACYITNVLPWRPPGNRTPTDGEVSVCLPFLQRQIDLIKPKIILLLGASAANAVLNNGESISKLRGHFTDYQMSDGSAVPTIASFHPAYLLRAPAQKAKAWSDFLRIKKYLTEV